MDPFHERLARIALEVAATYGFALAGGYAIQAHGFLDRPSADVDLFAEATRPLGCHRAHLTYERRIDYMDEAHRSLSVGEIASVELSAAHGTNLTGFWQGSNDHPMQRSASA